MTPLCSLPGLAVQVAAPPGADAAAPGAGDSGLHADAVRHDLQHLDLPGGRRRLGPRLLCGVSAAERRLTGREGPARPGSARSSAAQGNKIFWTRWWSWLL